MKIIDISMTFGCKMLTYEGDPPFSLKFATNVEEGNSESYNISILEFSTHSGTHIDPPLHFLERGKGEPINKVSLEILCGPARVIDVKAAGEKITAEILKKYDLNGVERLLLKTINSNFLDKPFNPNYAHLTVDGAKFLREQTKVRLIGIDYLSIENYPSPGFLVHRTLLAEKPPIYILEGIDLRSVESGDYELYCLPLKIEDGDGGPARAILIA